MKPFATILVVTVLMNLAVAHDTWVEVNTPEVREGNLVHVDLKLGNHGNDHRDFKLAGLITLDHATLAVHAPGGQTTDLKPRLVGTASAEKQGYWSTRFVPSAPGLHLVAHELDTLHGKIRAIKSAKTYFIVGHNSPLTASTKTRHDQPLGYPLELVPLTNPVTESGPNKPIRVRVLFEQKPLANARVTFIPRGQELTKDFDEAFERATDANGHAEFTPTEGNLILVVVHHRAPDQSGDGYESTAYSATLTVAVPQVPYPATPSTAGAQ